HAIPRRHTGGAGGPAEGAGDDGAWRRVPRGAGDGRVSAAGGVREKLGARATISARDGRKRAGAALRRMERGRAPHEGDVPMKRSENRILTTHVGSLIRPPDLQELLAAKRDGKRVDDGAFNACLERSVRDVVQQQAAVGLDIINDGELGKTISWSRYVLER